MRAISRSELSVSFAAGLWLAWPAWVWPQSIVGTIADGAGGDVAVNTVTNTIYVLGAHSVAVIDGATLGFTTVSIPGGIRCGWRVCGPEPLALAVNETTNKIYVINQCYSFYGLLNPLRRIYGTVYVPGSITVIDGATKTPTTIVTDPSGVCPRGLALNPTTNKIYAANYIVGGNANVTVVDGATNTTTTVTDPNAKGGAAGVAVNPVTNRIYVANWGTPGNITVIDGVTNMTTTVTDPNALDPYAVAVNSTTNQVYVANIGTGVGASLGNVTVINGSTNKTTTVTDRNANHPWAVAVNSVTNKIYVANQLSNNLTVIDGAANSTTTVSDPNAVQPASVAVNEQTNRVYVANAGGTNAAGGANPGSITVINASNSTTSILNPQATYSDAVGVNPVTDEIYVANLNSANLTVLDGAGTPTTHTLWVLPVPNAGNASAGTGTVTSNPAGISCGGSCVASFAVGTAISLSASGGSSAIFKGWSGPCAAGTAPCDLVANADQFVTAVFSLTVPSVVGLTQAAATAAITNAGLSVGTVAPASSNGVAPGNVISESPAAGTVAAAGSTVNLVVSDDDVVPNVVGGTTSAASTAITGGGLIMGTVTLKSSGAVSLGDVISESPAAGSYIAPGSAVNLVVSGAAVPGVVGQTQAAAAAAITSAGLSIGSLTRGSSDGAAPGNVISESPAAGTVLAGGSAVNLVVSDDVAVPQLVGTTISAASSGVTGAGLIMGAITQQSSNTVASGDVIRESPAAGSYVGPGSSVNLVVSTGSASSNGNSTGGGGGGGGGALDWLTVGALLSCLTSGLRRAMRGRFRAAQP